MAHKQADWAGNFLENVGSQLWNMGTSLIGVEHDFLKPWYDRHDQVTARKEKRANDPIWQTYNKDFGGGTWDDDSDFNFSDVMDIGSQSEGVIQMGNTDENMKLTLINYLKSDGEWNDDEIMEFVDNKANWKDLLSYDPQKALNEITEGARTSYDTAISKQSQNLGAVIDTAQRTQGFTNVSYGDTMSKAISDAYAAADPYGEAYKRSITQGKGQVADEFWDIMQATTGTT